MRKGQSRHVMKSVKRGLSIPNPVANTGVARGMSTTINPDPYAQNRSNIGFSSWNLAKNAGRGTGISRKHEAGK